MHYFLYSYNNPLYYFSYITNEETEAKVGLISSVEVGIEIQALSLQDFVCVCVCIQMYITRLTRKVI